MKKFNILCLAAAIAAPLLTGCSSGSDTPDEPTAPDTASYTITLVAKDGGMNSRAGLDKLDATTNEKLIHNVTLLLYRKSIAAGEVTSESSGNIDYVIYQKFDSPATSVTMTIKKVLIGQYYGVALVNMYSDASEAKDAWKDKTIYDLLTREYSGAPYTSKDNLNDINDFVMTSDKEFSHNFSSTSAPKTIQVERITSRVDLKLQGLETVSSDDGTSTTYYKVPVYYCNSVGNPCDANGDDLTGTSYEPTGDYMYINSIGLYNTNGYEGTTYYIQRASTGSYNTSNVTYFADEDFGDTYANNYVVCATGAKDNWPLPWDASAIFNANHLLKETDTSSKYYNYDYYTLTYIGEKTNYDYTYDSTTKELSDTYPYLEIKFNYDSPTDLNIDDSERSLKMPILHCKPESDGTIDYSQPMAIAVIRNTVYRFNLAFFANEDLIYVRWYYYSGSGSNLTQTSYATAISSRIKDSGKSTDPITPAD